MRLSSQIKRIGPGTKLRYQEYFFNKVKEINMRGKGCFMESSHTLADMAVFFPAQYENLQNEIHRGLPWG